MILEDLGAMWTFKSSDLWYFSYQLLGLSEYGAKKAH
jgi:hypothetical protein